jgi:2,3-bisphosphoglycerate-dependent phosphoglycerate mutase
MIVFALRHADRKPADDDLSPAGVERATLLARMLAESGIRTVYCSDAVRTQLTVAPLKKLLGAKLEVVVVPTTAAGGVAAHVQHIVEAVKALPDDAVAAVVGHSNTVGPVIKGLTGRKIDPIADEFDKLFVVSIPAAGASTVAPLRYGQAT